MESSSTAPAENPTAMRREIDRLKADLERLRSDFSGLTGDAIHAAKTGAGQAKERVQEGARAAVAKGQESAEALGEQIGAHPFMSCATAFAVGMVVGLGLFRKN